MLQGREDFSAPINFQLLDSDGNMADEWDIGTDLFGKFCIEAVPPGEWDLTAKEPHYLRAVYRGLEIPGLMGDVMFDPETGDPPGTLRGGDCEDDNDVDIGDFAILAAAYGTMEGDPGYDPRADITADGMVNLKDFSPIASNFGKVGVGGVVAAPIAYGVNGSSRFLLEVDGMTDVADVPIGSVFTVNVKASDASDLHGYSFDIAYDASALQLVSRKEEGFLKETGAKTLFFARESDNTLTTAGAIVGREAGVSGDGVVASFAFRTIGKRSGDISLSTVKTTDHIGRLNILPPNLISIRVVPKLTALAQNYPNPFNPDTWMPYQLREDADVLIKIFDVSGKLVRTIHLGYKDAGFYVSRDKAAYWNGRNEQGETVGSGVYFYTLETGKFSATRKMMIVK
jgi:hypothetical protein